MHRLGRCAATLLCCCCSGHSSFLSRATIAGTTTAFLSLPVTRPRLSHFTSKAMSDDTGGLADIGGAATTTTAASSSSTPKAQNKDEHKPQWLLHLERALGKNSKDAHARYIQLATVGQDKEGVVKPFVRTVVYRGIHHHPDDEAKSQPFLKMITDSRSEKIVHLAHNPHAEIAWYFTKTREQFRLSGTVQVVTSTCKDKPLLSARKHQWSCLSDGARVQFLWPFPKEASPSDQDASVFSPEPVPGPGSVPPETFCLLLFKPQEIDHLELKVSPQRRTVHVHVHGQGQGQEKESGKEWVTTKVNP